MRINEPKNVSGYFWLPTSPQKRLGGTLRITEGGRVEIELVGNFDSSTDEFSSLDEIPRILCEVEDLGRVTLDSCLYRNKTLSFAGEVGGVGKSTLICGRAFAGIHFGAEDKAVFNAVTFCVEGLDEWLGVTGIKFNPEAGGSAFTVTYERPNLPEIPIRDGYVLKFGFSVSFPGFPLLKEATIRQKASITLKTQDLKELGEFIELIHKITNFLGFAVGQIVSVVELKACIRNPDNEQNEKQPPSQRADVYYPSLPYSKTKPKIAWYNQLFGFKYIRNDPGAAFMAWLNAYDVIGPPLDLYFAAISDAAKYVDSKFLFLAQALETWHRRTSDSLEMDSMEFNEIVEALIGACPDSRREWLKGRLCYANEIGLGKRLNELLLPFESFLPQGAKLKRFTRLIVDTRNYLTHYNPSLEGRAARGGALLGLSNRMEAFFALLLLSRIGFTPEQLIAITQENRDFQYKMKDA